MKIRLALFLASIFSVASTAPSLAAGDRYALVIGNSKYPDADAPLREPVNDAHDIADELKRDGFQVLPDNAAARFPKAIWISPTPEPWTPISSRSSKATGSGKQYLAGIRRSGEPAATKEQWLELRLETYLGTCRRSTARSFGTRQTGQEGLAMSKTPGKRLSKLKDPSHPFAEVNRRVQVVNMADKTASK